MDFFAQPRRALTGAAIVAALGVFTATGHGQLQSAPAAKAVVQQLTLPAIDRGLRDQDAPRAARTAADAGRVRGSRGETLPYLRGSIIVKFKDDATSGAISA